MPIKDHAIYPPYWKQFSLHIRKRRAKDKCEACTVPNGYWKAVLSFDGDSFVRYFATEDEAYLSGCAVVRTSKIVLTVAHLDHEGGPCQCKAETGRKCARPDHVLALCQACHLMLDMPKHIENRRQTMITRKDASRGLLAGMEVAGA